MKEFLRLMGKLCPEKQRSAVSYQLSAMSNQLLAKLWLIPKTYKNQLSAISNQPSALDSLLPAKSWLLPKAYYLIPILILVFVSCGAALAQDVAVKATPAAKAELITPLKIGDKIPDELWEMYFPVVSANSDEVQYLSLGDFKDKLIILDFWATWCAPCISSLHKLDTLQKEFREDLLVVPTSYETEDKILSFLSDRKINLPSLIEETELKKYFPYRSIPHQVWLKDNKVLAIVGPESTNRQNVFKGIKGEDLNVLLKSEDMSFDFNKPLLLDGNGGGVDKVLTLSLFSKRIGLESAGVIYRKDGLFIYNLDVLGLYMEAFSGIIPLSGRLNRVVFNFEDVSLVNKIKSNGYSNGDVEDPNKTVKWKDENTYCYNMISHVPLSKEKIKEIFLKDLNQFFENTLGITAKLIDREMMSYVLVKTGNDPLALSSQVLDRRGQNSGSSIKSIRSLVSKLQINNEESSVPIIDATDYDRPVDIFLTSPLTDLPSITKELQLYGLDLQKKYHPIRVLEFTQISKKL